MADNLDIGRPDEIKLIFDRQIRTNTKGEFATKVVTRGTEVTINAFYKHSRIKEYLKEGRALRIETVVNSPTDLGAPAPPPEPRRARQERPERANRRLLEVQRAGQGCAIETALFGADLTALARGGPKNRSVALRGSTRHGPGRRTLRGARQPSSASPTRASGLGVPAARTGPYSQSQMTYDLRRLRLKGLIVRVHHTNSYVLT